MNATGVTQPMRLWPESARWAVCFVLAVAFHVAGAAALLARWNSNDDLVANAPVITIELAALPVAPETTPNEIPPGPQQQEAEPEPEPEKPLEKKLELPPDPKAEPLQAVMPPPKVEKPPRKSPSRSTQAFRARPALPRQDLNVRQHQCPGPTRITRMQCRTGSRSWWPSSSATSAIRPRRNHAVSRVLHNLHSALTAVVAYIMHASCGARDRVRSIKQPWRWSDARHRCHRLRLKLRVAKFRSRYRSATACGNWRQPAFWSTGAALLGRWPVLRVHVPASPAPDPVNSFRQPSREVR